MPIDMTRLNVGKTYKLYINGESAHMDVNAIDATGVNDEMFVAVQKTAAENVKRVVRFDGDAIGWNDASRSQSPYAIFDFQEMKTVWHPVGM